MKRFPYAAAAIALAVAVTFAPAASAANGETPKLINNIPPQLGCELTYSITGTDISPEHARYLPDSLNRITAYTGMTFSEAYPGDYADIRYEIVERLPISSGLFDDDEAIGVAYEDGSIYFLPTEEVTAGIDDEKFVQVAVTNLITHETLHVLGLDHDETPTGENEIMNPYNKMTSTEFGESDKAGMEALREANGCLAPTIAPPADVTAPQPTLASELIGLFTFLTLFTVIIVVPFIIIAVLYRRNRAKRYPTHAQPVYPIPYPGNGYSPEPAPAYIPPPQPPAGWYPDPAGNLTLLRWWDGQQWTPHTQNLTQPPRIN